MLSQEPELDEVDKILAKQDGKISRPMGRLCHHGPRQKCTNCLPIDPYDGEYLAEKGIKHMSFQAYVRKLTDLHGKGTRLTKPLENVNCQLKQNCTMGHKPYPAGICAKCRPPTLTLMRQVWRHVDNVVIENGSVVDRFLDGWRISSHQRVGFLIGCYEPFTEVPLGVRARVCAIYEPPQDGAQDSVHLAAEDPYAPAVDKLLGWLGMQRVGWLFTDLWTKDARAGTVHCIRNEESFLLSAEECITAGWLQLQHKNRTQFCSDGYFGSKFVTVLASGDSEDQIHLSGYQVSNQCMAMVEADILCPTRGHPEFAWVRETPLNDTHYITEIQYSEKNEYGLEVTRNGRPMPVEYLLVDVPTATPLQPLETFTSGNGRFPIENRAHFGELQDVESVRRYIGSFPKTPEGFLRLASDFHFLLFLLVNDLGLGISENEVETLARAVIAKDATTAWEVAENSEGIKKLLANTKSTKKRETATSSLNAQMSAASAISSAIQEASASVSIAAPTAPVDIVEIDHEDFVEPMEEVWSCEHCTFENTGAGMTSCEMCNLPRSGHH